MFVLAIDTTAKTATASLCRVENQEVLPVSCASLNGTLTHSESTLPMIDFCLTSANVDINEVDVLAVSAGPGSFTGVRIGISTIKGLAFGRTGVKCIPVSALEALAGNTDDEARGTLVCPCMDARRNQVYNALFSCNGNGNIKRLTEDRAVSLEDLYTELYEKYSSRKIVLVGDGARLAMQYFSSQETFNTMKICLARADRLLQDSVSVARTAFRHIDKEIMPEKLNPVYLRLSQAERERNERMEKQ